MQPHSGGANVLAVFSNEGLDSAFAGEDALFFGRQVRFVIVREFSDGPSS